MEDALPHVYVTGHKNPDTDTIASAIGYAEYKNLVDPENHYVAARLGEVNAQTGWALKKSGAEKPGLLEHIMLRVKDVMAGDVAVARSFHFRREPCLGRGDGRGARRRASGRGGRQ